jgi:tetratricopeptide (TPR) repeat protein
LKVFRRIWLLAVLVTLALVPAAFAQGSSRGDALALEQQGKNAEAETIWQEIARTNPRSPEAFAHLGLLEARQQHYDQAVGFYRQALALDATLPGLEMNLGLALFKNNKFQESIQPFTVELRRHPGDLRLTILLGMAHYGMQDYLVAIPYLKKAAEEDPQNLPLRLTLAHSCMWSKQFQCVLDVYKEILALNAESAEADMLAGEALDEKGDYPGAIEQFRAAVKANPKEPEVHFGLGYLLWTQKQFEEATKEFQAELENDPKHAQALQYLGDIYLLSNRYSDAEAALVKALNTDPSSAFAHRDLGVVYAEIGRKDDAVKELEKAVSLDPKDVAPHWRLARLYQSMGRKDEAKAEFNKASTMNKETNDALYKKMSVTPAGQPH